MREERERGEGQTWDPVEMGGEPSRGRSLGMGGRNETSREGRPWRHCAQMVA